MWLRSIRTCAMHSSYRGGGNLSELFGKFARFWIRLHDMHPLSKHLDMATRFSYRSFSREEEEGSKIAQIARLSQFTASFATSVISRTANPSINEEIRRNQHLRSTLPMFPAGTIYNIPSLLPLTYSPSALCRSRVPNSPD